MTVKKSPIRRYRPWPSARQSLFLLFYFRSTRSRYYTYRHGFCALPRSNKRGHSVLCRDHSTPSAHYRMLHGDLHNAISPWTICKFEFFFRVQFQTLIKFFVFMKTILFFCHHVREFWFRQTNQSVIYNVYSNITKEIARFCNSGVKIFINDSSALNLEFK